MKNFSNPTVNTAAVFFLLLGLLAFSIPARAAGNPIHSGDLLTVQYTCRLQTGEIVDTNNPHMAIDPGNRYSRIYVAKDSYAAVPMRAGETPLCPVNKAEALLPHKEFEKEIAARIAASLVGQPAGRPLKLELTADEQAQLPDEERYVRVARMTQLPKKMQVSRRQFEQQFDPNPKVGGTLGLYPELWSRITAVTDTVVEVRFEAKSDGKVPSDFGDAVVHEKPEHFIIEILARKGDLVRTGPVVGRISDVQETMLTLDFGHPFGGQTLFCDVMAEAPAANIVAAAETGSMCLADGTAVLPGFEPARITDTVEPPTAAAEADSTVETPGVVQKNDLVELDYVVSMSDGRVVATTVADVYSDPNRTMAAEFVKPDSFAPLMIKAGEADGFPGLSDNVLGMHVGQSRRVELAPGVAFGTHDPRLVSQYRKTRYLPKTVSMAAKDYLERFGSFPVVGKEVAYNPYLNARVEAIDRHNARLTLLFREDDFSEDYGTVQVREEAERFAIVLNPTLGEDFTLQNRRGRIIADDGTYFTVDYNHPLASEPLKLEIKLVSLSKPSQFRNLDIQWIEDFDAGLETARDLNKPAVLVLYADWCGYSTRLLDESIADPRVKLLKDDFIWIKIDSHKNTQFKTLFEQTSYPLIVVMSPTGETLKQLKGYQAAPVLRQELKNLIGSENTIAMQ